MPGEEERGEFEAVEDSLCCPVEKKEGKHLRPSTETIENSPSPH